VSDIKNNVKSENVCKFKDPSVATAQSINQSEIFKVAHK
jgi:hypothetical protein